MNWRNWKIAAALLAAAGTGGAQPAATGPKFDVVSIKPRTGEIAMSSDPSVRGRRVSGKASTLSDLITWAYNVRSEQVGGAPAWAGGERAEHYDLDAASEGEGVLTSAQAKLMVQTLLADRFHLKIHRETLEVPIYALVVARNGARLKEAAADAPGHNSVNGTGNGTLHMSVTKGTMEQLALQLSVTAGRHVVDQTGLKGYYSYTLDWFPANNIAPPDLDAPSMFDALQLQLGLKLEPGKGPIDMLMIDHVEKPSEN